MYTCQCTNLQSWCCSNAWLLPLILHLPEHIKFENKKYLDLMGEVFCCSYRATIHG